MNILWLDDAINDLRSLQEYIAQDNPGAAGRVARKILYSIDLLLTQPGIGKPGRISGTRELIVPRTPYIIPYRIKNNVIEILRILHSAKMRPTFFVNS